MSDSATVVSTLKQQNEEFLAYCGKPRSEEIAAAVKQCAFTVLTKLSDYCRAQKDIYLENRVTDEINRGCLSALRESREFLRDLKKHVNRWARVPSLTSDELDCLEEQRIEVVIRLEELQEKWNLEIIEEEASHRRASERRIAYRRIRIQIGNLLDQFAEELRTLANTASSSRN